jgi:hypothetical protein
VVAYAPEAPISRSRSLIKRSASRPPTPTPAPSDRREDLIESPFVATSPSHVAAPATASSPLPDLPFAAPGAPVTQPHVDAPVAEGARPNRGGLHLTGEFPILRDLPFGKGPGYGRETPFAPVSPSRPTQGSDDAQTEGIPTGLPPVLSRLDTVQVDGHPTEPRPMRRAPVGAETQPPTSRTAEPEAMEGELETLRRTVAVAARRSVGLLFVGLITGFVSGLLVAKLLF